MLSEGSACTGTVLASLDALALARASFAPVGVFTGAATGVDALFSAKNRTLRRAQKRIPATVIDG